MPKPANKVELADLEPGLLIDEHALDQACARHPDLFYRVAKRLADEVSMRDALKEQLANVEALVDTEIREEAAAENEKPTVKEIESRTRLDLRVEKVRKHLLETGAAVGQWMALKDAFTQRSYMLKALGELYVSNYYSDTSTSAVSSTNAQADRAKRALQEERVRRK
jgi:hypothetical protein